jgi:hypothetical protein
MTSKLRVTGALVLILIATAPAAHGTVDVKIDFDRKFDFKAVRTWAWHPDVPGEVKMARTAEDDPEAARQQAQPVIVAAVVEEMGRRGRQLTADVPDVFIMYYLLLTLSVSAQTVGQFVPATPDWGLPPFTPATQSFELMNQGALVIDVSANQSVVWRGVAQARIKFGADRARRETLIREAVRDLIRRLPKRP